jgi:hypothetical protein
MSNIYTHASWRTKGRKIYIADTIPFAPFGYAELTFDSIELAFRNS